MDYQNQADILQNNSKETETEKQLLPLGDLQLAYVGGGCGEVLFG